MVRSPSKPVEQISRRLSEQNNGLQFPNSERPVKFLSADSEANSCCMMLDGNILTVSQVDSNKIVGFKHKDLMDLYRHPIMSARLRIFKTSSVDSVLRTWPITLLYQKCVRLRYGTGFAVIPLMH
ncbi:unnamed protein product, partial [Ixodes pacificus]